MPRGRPRKQVAGSPPAEKPLPDLPPNAYQANGQPYARARLKDPHNPHYYYSDGRVPWVLVGYKVWSMDEWREKFKGQQPDGRNWDFFGDPIDIWPNGEEGGYSSE